VTALEITVLFLCSLAIGFVCGYGIDKDIKQQELKFRDRIFRKKDDKADIE
jgi:hypothetical protein